MFIFREIFKLSKTLLVDPSRHSKKNKKIKKASNFNLTQGNCHSCIDFVLIALQFEELSGNLLFITAGEERASWGIKWVRRADTVEEVWRKKPNLLPNHQLKKKNPHYSPHFSKKKKKRSLISFTAVEWLWSCGFLLLKLTQWKTGLEKGSSFIKQVYIQYIYIHTYIYKKIDIYNLYM